MDERLSPGAVFVCSQLEKAGFEAYLVGGCVRDLLLGRQPADFDIATNALPEEIRSIFQNSQEAGEAFLVSRVQYGPETVEIATYRKDFYPVGGASKPESVHRVDRIEEDLRRRDFTVNAIAMDIRGNYVDPLQGLPDVRNGVLRETHGNAFAEDPVRILRGFKFQARFGWPIHPETWRHMEIYSTGLAAVAEERLQKELQQTLAGRFAVMALANWRRLGLLPVILPELAENSEMDWQELIAAAARIPAEEPLIRLAALLCGASSYQAVIRRFGVAKKQDQLLEFLVKQQGLPFSADEASVKSWLARQEFAGWPAFRSAFRALTILSLARGQVQAGSVRGDVLKSITQKAAAVRRLDGKFPLGVQDLPFTGHELVRRGIQGREIGDVLRQAVAWMQLHGNNSWELFWARLDS